MTTTTTTAAPTTGSSKKPTWKVFWDLQCPYSRKNWEKLPEIMSRFQAKYDFEIHLTSLLFHPQAFRAQCAANLIAVKQGPRAKQTFIDACLVHQERYMNAAIGDDARPSEVDAIFATIAEEAGVFSDTTTTTNLTREYFLSHLSDWEEAVQPAYAEHKIALSYGVFGTPKQVIGDKLMEDTESSWGADEWATYLEKSMGS